MVEAPPGRDVADHHDAPPLPAGSEIGEEAADAVGRLAPALAARERLVEVGGSILAVRLGRLGVALAVVALAQSPVEEDRHRAVTEGDLGGLDGAAKVRAEHGGDILVAPARSHLARLVAATLGQPAVRPTRRDAELVV